MASSTISSSPDLESIGSVASPSHGWTTHGQNSDHEQVTGADLVVHVPAGDMILIPTITARTSQAVEDVDIELGLPSPSPANGAEDVPGAATEETDTGGQWYKTRMKETMGRFFPLTFTFLIGMIGVLIMTIHSPKPKKPFSKNFGLIAEVISAVASTAIEIGCLFTMKLMSGLRPSTRSLVDILLCTSRMFLIFAQIAITASFLPSPWYGVVLLVTLSAVANGLMYSYSVGRRSDARNKAYGKRSDQLSVTIAGMSCAGAFVYIIGVGKNFDDRADHEYVKVAIYVLIGASLMSLESVAIQGAIFQKMLSRCSWENMLFGNTVILCAVAFTATVAGSTFLGLWVIATAVFPVMFVAAIMSIVKFYELAKEVKEEEMKRLFAWARGLMALSFSALMLVYSTFLGGGLDTGKNVEFCIFSLMSCFVVSLGLAAITFWVPKNAIYGATANTLFYLSLGLVASAIIALFTACMPPLK